MPSLSYPSFPYSKIHRAPRRSSWRLINYQRPSSPSSTIMFCAQCVSQHNPSAIAQGRAQGQEGLSARAWTKRRRRRRSDSWRSAWPCLKDVERPAPHPFDETRIASIHRTRALAPIAREAIQIKERNRALFFFCQHFTAKKIFVLSFLFFACFACPS